MRYSVLVPLVLTACMAATTASAASQDEQMMRLASTSGCLACHGVQTAKPGPAGMAPIGPAWRDVSSKYKGQKDALADLTRTVMRGSSPYHSHWQGKVSGLAMPPNAVAIKEADAKKLVAWILALEK